MSTTSRDCAQVWSNHENFKLGLERLATLGEEDAVIIKNIELVFLVPSLCSANSLNGQVWKHKMGSNQSNSGLVCISAQY